MNWKDILKGEEIHPTVRSMDAKEQKEIKEEIVQKQHNLRSKKQIKRGEEND